MRRATDRARIGRALLALCGHRAEDAALLSAADWQALDALADQHRLRPYLHARAVGGAISGPPEEVALGWQTAHRANAIAMLAQRRALTQLADTLARDGIGAVALKGSALAWTVWPAPAQRVMRDIDVLVAEADAPRAYRSLCDAGWKAPELSETAAARFAEEETHFPPLYSPEGVMCEMHAHMWARPPLPGSTMPSSDDAGVLSRAKTSDDLGMAIPSNEDMLAHLVVHAACSHLLNVGPMALIDVALWCRNRSIEWDLFWSRAQSHGYDRAAALVFALTERWQWPGLLELSDCPIWPDADLLDEAELLLVQDLDARKDVSAIASLAKRQVGGRLGQHPLDRAEQEVSSGERLAQLAGRAVSLGSSLLTRATRRDGIATARLQDWIEG